MCGPFIAVIILELGPLYWLTINLCWWIIGLTILFS